jgi:hypothetical protein
MSEMEKRDVVCAAEKEDMHLQRTIVKYCKLYLPFMA